MFNLGFGELLMLLIIVAVVFGSIKLPQLGAGLAHAMKRHRESLDNPEPPRLLLQRRAPRRWTLSDRVLAVAAVALAGGVIGNAALRAGWVRSDWVLVIAAVASGTLALALLRVPRR